MAAGNQKFLVQFLEGVTGKQIFFVLWAGIVAIFVSLMYAHYRRYTRRNFRGPGDLGPPLTRIDNRQLPDPSKGKEVAKKDGEAQGS